jgi:hypothetical protein
MNNATTIATQEVELELRPAGNCSWRPPGGYIVSVVGGPQDLLWRGTRELALKDGAEHVAKYWRFNAELGRWVAGNYETEVQS